jgi:hypothetical protein
MLEAYAKAQAALAATGDPHAAIDLLDAAEASAVFEGSGDFPDALLPIARAYGVWLTQTLDRYERGILLLEPGGPGGDPAERRALTEAYYKRYVLERDPQSLAQAQEQFRQTGGVPAGQPLVPLPNFPGTLEGSLAARGIARVVPIDFGAFPDVITFNQTRMYIGRWYCPSDHHYEGGVTLEVRDRDTGTLIKSVPVIECDNQYQDSIGSISFTKRHIVLGIGYRYEEDGEREGRPTEARIDKTSLEVVRMGRAASPRPAVERHAGRRYTCTCMNRYAVDQCRDMDAGSGPPPQSIPAYFDGLLQTCRPYPLAVRGLERQVVAANARYTIADLGGNSGPARLAFYRNDGTRMPGEFEGPGRQTGGTRVLALTTTGRVLLVTGEPSATHPWSRLWLHDIPTGRTVTLLTPRIVRGEPSVTATWKDWLFVSLGRDLLVYDLNRRVLVHYDKEFIAEGMADNGNGVDKNGIRRLLVDEGRLWVLTFDGFRSRVVDLARLKEFRGREAFAVDSRLLALEIPQVQVVGAHWRDKASLQLRQQGKWVTPRAPSPLIVRASGGRRREVVVPASDKPVWLYLESYQPTDWVVSAAPGARLERVVLIGQSSDSLSGVDANVIVHRNHGPGCFSGWGDRTDDEIARCVAKVLGIEPSSILSAESFLRSGP